MQSRKLDQNTLTKDLKQVHIEIFTTPNTFISVLRTWHSDPSAYLRVSIMHYIIVR